LNKDEPTITFQTGHCLYRTHSKFAIFSLHSFIENGGVEKLSVCGVLGDVETEKYASLTIKY